MIGGYSSQIGEGFLDEIDWSFEDDDAEDWFRDI